MSSSNGNRKQRRHEPEQRALARRISRQLAHDERHRPASLITLPKLTFIDDERGPDGAAPERAA